MKEPKEAKRPRLRAFRSEVRSILKAIGEDPDRQGLEKTPQRVDGEEEAVHRAQAADRAQDVLQQAAGAQPVGAPAQRQRQDEQQPEGVAPEHHHRPRQPVRCHLHEGGHQRKEEGRGDHLDSADRQVVAVLQVPQSYHPSRGAQAGSPPEPHRGRCGTL
jgi:hypothetical protein